MEVNEKSRQLEVVQYQRHGDPNCAQVQGDEIQFQKLISGCRFLPEQGEIAKNLFLKRPMRGSGRLATDEKRM
jgi:hypothetical protein